MKRKKEVLEVLRLVTKAVQDKKAERVKILRVSELIKITDFFVICSADSTTQVGAIADELEKTAEENNLEILGIEGRGNNLWVLVDFGDVVVHVFHEPVRAFYDLDGLWQEAEQIDPDALLSQGREKRINKHEV